ncbi:MAG: tRNA preQ1(34) S-adenosylmethionine ribosyltransferase-isomerase QueA [Chloroflexota bacterium]|nr:tRNA preQ1(34) S-adenosylmethionine ribosyltransferase-isomerase QueA [Chloroflexota bacterium]
MNVADFDYDLPASFIAQTPAEPRDSARLLHLDRETGALTHRVFADIFDLTAANDVLVLNNTRVMRARLAARKTTGGKVEILLLKRLSERRWLALAGGRNIRAGIHLLIPGSDLTCKIVEELEKSQRVIDFSRPIDDVLARHGEMPLPPYIHSAPRDRERYQTVYSEIEGSAAAPTAGLHFTPELLRKLERKGVKLATCTLHIGLDTFQPVAVQRVCDHRIHSEQATLDRGNAAIINEAKRAGGRIIAVGTTSARTLETAAILSAGGSVSHPSKSADKENGFPLRAIELDTSLFIYPGYRWRAVDAMITNFHLPRSTLLMMLSAFAGRETLLKAYEEAKRMHYRFYSFGDAMFIS